AEGPSDGDLAGGLRVVLAGGPSRSGQGGYRPGPGVPSLRPLTMALLKVHDIRRLETERCATRSSSGGWGSDGPQCGASWPPVGGRHPVLRLAVRAVRDGLRRTLTPFAPL